MIIDRYDRYFNGLTAQRFLFSVRSISLWSSEVDQAGYSSAF